MKRLCSLEKYNLDSYVYMYLQYTSTGHKSSAYAQEGYSSRFVCLSVTTLVTQELIS